MKRLITAFVVLLICSMSAQATSWTLSNQASLPAQFNSLADAIAGAAAGDTIYVLPSPNNYDNTTGTLNKSLTFIGPGIWAKSNTGIAEFFSMTIEPTASGSRFYGLGLRYTNARAVAGNVDNIIFEGCLFRSAKIEFRGSNWTFQNCLFLSNGTGGIQGDNLAANNVLISNCLFSSQAILAQLNSSTVTVRNCVLYQGTTSGFNLCDNLQIENCIFYGKDPSGCANCNFDNCLTYVTPQDVIPYGSNGGSGNFIGVDPLFENAPLPGNLSAAGLSTIKNYDFRLKATSPGKNAGTDGTDIGLYGGSKPYNPNVVAPVPQIDLMQIQNVVVPIGGNVDVKVISTLPK